MLNVIVYIIITNVVNRGHLGMSIILLVQFFFINYNSA